MDIQSTLVGYKQLVLLYLILVQYLQSIESQYLVQLHVTIMLF